MQTPLSRRRLLAGGLLLALFLWVVWFALRTPPLPPARALGDVAPAPLRSPGDAPRLIGQKGTAPRTEEAAPAPSPTLVSKDPVSAPKHRIRVRFEGPGEEPALVGLVVVGDDDWDKRFAVVIGPSRVAALPSSATGYKVIASILDEWASDQSLTDVQLVSPGLYEVVLELPGQTTLRVREVGSGRPLSEAYAYPASWRRGYGAVLPTPPADRLAQKPQRANDAGEIKLPRTACSLVWWVGAPGRAWSRVHAAPDKAAVDAALAAGGALRVEITCPGELPPYALRIARIEEGEEVVPRCRGELLQTEEGRFHVQGLQSGSWRVLVGSAATLSLRDVWARRDVEVVAGQTGEVVIHVPEQEMVERYEVRAELVVPNAWETLPTSVWLMGALEENLKFRRAFDVETDGRGSPWPLLWKDVPRGLYEVKVYPFQQSWYVHVPADGPEPRLEVPPPVRVEVRVVDADSGTLIPDAEVTISLEIERPPEVTGWSGSGDRAHREKPGGPLVGRVRAGRVEIAAQAPGYVSQGIPATVDAARQPHEQTVRLARGATVVVRVLSGGALLRAVVGEARSLYEPNNAAEEEDWGWEDRSRGLEGGSAQIDGLVPGTYTFSVSLSGEKDPPSQRIKVKAGERRVIDFEISGD